MRDERTFETAVVLTADDIAARNAHFERRGQSILTQEEYERRKAEHASIIGSIDPMDSDARREARRRLASGIRVEVGNK